MELEERTYKLDEVYEYLKRFRVSDSLFVIGVINAILKFNFTNLYTENIPQGALVWLNDVAADEKDKIALSIHITRLARFLLLSPSNDYKKEILDTGSLEMSNALNMVSSLLDLDDDEIPKTEADMVPIMGRILQSQFPLQRDRGVIIGRAQVLFIEIPAKLGLEYDIDAKMQEYFGMGVFEFIASGIALWLLTNGVLKFEMNVEVDALKDVVTQDNLNKFIELSSGTAEDYRRIVRGDDWKTSNKRMDLYAHEPLTRMPIVKIGHSLALPNTSYVVPQALYLLQRASVGIFYLLGDKERELARSEGQEAKKNDFRNAFGTIYRAYVGMQLGQATGATAFVDVDADFPDLPNGIKKPDFALINEGVCVLFEVKTGLVTLDSRTILDKDKAREEIRAGSFKKGLDQLDSFAQAIIKGEITDMRFASVKHVVKVLVGFEDLYLANAFLLPLTREIYPEQASMLQVAGLTDIEEIGDFMERGGSIGPAMLEKVTADGISDHALTPFIGNKEPKATRKPVLLHRAFETFMQRASGGKLFSGEDA